MVSEFQDAESNRTVQVVINGYADKRVVQRAVGGMSLLYRAEAALGRTPAGVLRGKVFAKRMSCPTLRIFSANGSRASFWRISSFMP